MIEIKTLNGTLLYTTSSDSLASLCLARLNLQCANLRGANLRGANLSGANLSGADMRGADMRGADMSGASLRDADMRGADMRGADMRASLRGADMRGADMRGADMSGASLSEANLRGADLREAKMISTILRNADFYEASLKGAIVYENAKLLNRTSIIEITNIGSRNDELRLFITDKGIYAQTGCFSGTIDEFIKAVKETHGGNIHAQAYLSAISIAKIYAEECECHQST